MLLASPFSSLVCVSHSSAIPSPEDPEAAIVISAALPLTTGEHRRLGEADDGSNA